MKNYTAAIVILVIVVLAFLLFFTNTEKPAINDIVFEPDTTKVNIKGNDEGGNVLPALDYDPYSIKPILNPKFLGLKYHQAMILIHNLQEPVILEMSDRSEEIEFIEFMYGDNHHILYFEDDVCVLDSLVKH